MLAMRGLCQVLTLLVLLGGYPPDAEGKAKIKAKQKTAEKKSRTISSELELITSGVSTEEFERKRESIWSQKAHDIVRGTSWKEPKKHHRRDPDPLKYSNLSAKGLLVGQEGSRRVMEERTHRRMLLRSEKCPLILFFSSAYGGAATNWQKKELSSDCEANYYEWKKAAINVEQQRLIPRRLKRTIAHEESFDGHHPRQCLYRQ